MRRAIQLLLCAVPSALYAQAAPTYLERYNEVSQLQVQPGQVADVHHLVLDRQGGRLILESGRIALLSPVGGRLVGAVFKGDGRFQFMPPVAIERSQLQQFASAQSLDEPITGVVMLFADSTADQLRALSFAAGDVAHGAQDDVNDLLSSLKGSKDGSFDTDVMRGVLNGTSDGSFTALITRAQGSQLLFQVNPWMAESVRILRPISRRRYGAPWAVVSQFSPEMASGSGGADWEFRDRLRIPEYTMDVTLSEAFSANLGFVGIATMKLSAQEAVGPWLLFSIEPTLGLDSAKWGAAAAPFFKARESYDSWVRAPRAMAPNDTATLTLYYHGELIDRVGNFFFVDPAANWYPWNGQGRTYATFDLTFHSPWQYPLVATGVRADSSRTGNVRNTHWIVRRASQFASFNLGLFQPQHMQYSDAPSLDVYLSDEAHSLLRRQFAAEGYDVPEQSHMRENVAVDVSNSLKMFGALFGDSPFSQFSITEIPFGEGVSFPGMIDLSWGTFHNTDIDGFDQFFRAHEVAHQWWGEGVRPGSYRDKWLAEGLASFCGLWYVEMLKRRDNEYYRFLDQYKTDIGINHDAGPIWVGYRASTTGAENGYQVMTYEKGAWVFQMLRSLFTDLGTMRSERFTETMKDYYQTFNGRSATTDDFRGIVERHIGAPMDWFFDQWVKGTAIPSYHVAWHSEPADNGKFRVRLRITQEHVPASFQMPVLVAVDLGGNRTARFRVNVSGSQTEYLSPLLPVEAQQLVFNDMHSVLGDVHMERW